jgi:hypothetical protein
VYLSHNAVGSDSDVGSVQHHDVAIFGDVVAEGTPSGFAGEGEAGESTEWEDFSIAVAHEASDVFVVVIMVEFIGTSTLCKDCVVTSDSKFADLLEDEFVDLAARKCTLEVAVN